jgi:hypothetical protein
MVAMRWLLQSPWGTLATSTCVAITTGIAIFGFGAPAVILLPITWGGAVVYMSLSTRFERRFGRR